MEVKLRKDFYGSKIAKVSSDILSIVVGFQYKGPAQTLNIELNTGKKGVFGDYDQESPAYFTSKVVATSEYPASYSISYSIPLSFWGTRVIDDCAVEVVISGVGVKDDAVLWDAYTVNVEVVPGKGTFTVYPMNPPMTYTEWCVDWSGQDGLVYRSSWATVGQPVVVQGPYGEAVPLVGRLAAWLWPGYGNAVYYGPTTWYTLKDEESYSYDITANAIYTR